MQRFDLDSLPIDDRVKLLLAVIVALSDSPFKSPKRWPQAIVVARAGELRVTSATDFAQWARANDLPELARECAQRAPAGCVRFFQDLDDENGAPVTGLMLVDIHRGAASLERARLALESTEATHA